MPQSRFTPRPQFLLLIPILLLTAFRPGDAPWVNDESLMMEMAIRYNRTASDLYGIHLPFTPCPFGLQGTRGARYGPLPIWIDQILLVFTHDIVLMLAIRAVLFSTLTALALCSLTKTLRLSPWFAVIVMLSPWIWLFSRSLWDSTWCIPFAGLLFASYAHFLASRSSVSLLLVAILCFLLPLIHLMGIALALPILLHCLIFNRERIWAARWKIGMALAPCLFLFWPYLFYLFSHLEPAVTPDRSAFLGWLFPLLGGHFLTLGVAGTMPGDGWQDYAPKNLIQAVEVLQWITRGSLLLVWLGMAIAIPRARSVIRQPGQTSVINHLCLISLAVWLCQTLLDGLGRVYFGPHYYSGTWIVYIFSCWIAADWLLSRVPKTVYIPVIAMYAASLVLGIAIIATTIAQNSGTRSMYYGTSLGNQVAAIQYLRQFDNDSAVDNQIPQWKSYPLSWKVLLELNPPTSDMRPRAHLLVRYRDEHPGDAAIKIEQLNP